MKANVVSDVLSRVSMGSMTHIENGNKGLIKELHHLTYLGVRLNSLSNGGMLVQNRVKSCLVEGVKEKKDMGLTLVELKKLLNDKKIEVSP